jgi:hypothetical protein
LVSGTNIKTINGASLLGPGNIPVVTSPSGVAGAIQFSNGSAFASDAANLFWDDTNKRLGIGTNAPQSKTEINSTGNQLSLSSSGDIYTYLKFSAQGGFASMIFGDGSGNINYLNNYSGGMWASNKFAFSPSYFTPSAQVHIKGSGSTSATTSLLVQNSAGTELFKVRDDNAVLVQNIIVNGYVGNVNTGVVQIGGGGTASANAYFNAISQSFGFGVSSINASAKLQIDSTTQGFLPPRMTTTQKNAITAVAGLVLYDSTTNKLQCYNGSTWNDLF